MIVSPCKGCKNEFEDKNKHPDCKTCTLPIEYVNKIGKSPSSSMEMEVQKMNDGKAPENPQTKITSPDPENTKPAPPSYKTEDLIEDHIKTMCEDHGMTIDQIRAGIQGLQHHNKRQKFHNIRDRLIKSLVSDEVFGELTQTQIGEILSMSGASVSHRMKKIGISPANPRGEFKKVVKRIKSKTTTPRQPIKVKETPVSHLVLNFTDHQETLEKISKVAKDLMREPEAQVLFWLVHSDFEKLGRR